MSVEDSLNGEEIESVRSMWMLAENCTISCGSMDPPSWLFVPEVESVEGVEVSKKGVYLTFRGRMLIPCLIGFNVYVKGGSGEGLYSRPQGLLQWMNETEVTGMVEGIGESGKEVGEMEAALWVGDMGTGEVVWKETKRVRVSGIGKSGGEGRSEEESESESVGKEDEKSEEGDGGQTSSSSSSSHQSGTWTPVIIIAVVLAVSLLIIVLIIVIVVVRRRRSDQNTSDPASMQDPLLMNNGEDDMSLEMDVQPLPED